MLVDVQDLRAVSIQGKDLVSWVENREILKQVVVERVLDVLSWQGGNIARRDRRERRRGQEKRYRLAHGYIVTFADSRDHGELPEQLVVQSARSVGLSMLQDPDGVVQIVHIPSQAPPQPHKAMHAVKFILRQPRDGHGRDIAGVRGIADNS